MAIEASESRKILASHDASQRYSVIPLPQRAVFFIRAPRVSNRSQPSRRQQRVRCVHRTSHEAGTRGTTGFFVWISREGYDARRARTAAAVSLRAVDDSQVSRRRGGDRTTARRARDMTASMPGSAKRIQMSFHFEGMTALAHRAPAGLANAHVLPIASVSDGTRADPDARC